MKNDKKKLIPTILAVLALIAVVGGATYAYFAADLGGGTGANINATTGTTDSLSFKTGDRIRIHADLDNFKAGENNLADSTTATATLKPNNTTNQAEAKYNIFFIIDDNDFKYTTVDKTPELILKVTDPEGNIITSITGLKGTDGEFDITTRTGAYLIAKDYVITTDKAEGETQSWKVEVTLINLPSNQNANMGKSLNGTIYITTEDEDTYKLPEINRLDAETTYSSITATLEVTEGTTEIDKYYFGKEEVNNATAIVNIPSIKRLSNKLASKDEIEYIETSNPSYEFTDLKDNATYKIYSYAVDKNGMKSNTYEAEITTDNYELPSIESVTHEVTTDSIKVVVTGEDGSNEIVRYYYSSDNGETYTEGLTSNEYTFIGLDAGTEYKIKIRVEDTLGRKSTEYYEEIKTEEAGLAADDFIQSIYTSQGEGGLYYHNGTIKNSSGTTVLDAGDNSYRYAGKNPNNFVCFGYDDETGEYASNWCPEDNLYRIIGIFDVNNNSSNPNYQIKLIKNTSIGVYYWTGSADITSGAWSDSLLNKVILNGLEEGNYLYSLEKWKNLISTHTWKVGGMTAQQGPVYNRAKVVYNSEVGSNITYEAKIGLMYLSDYGYAAPSSDWATIMHDYDTSANPSNNWLYIGKWEWTITPMLNSTTAHVVYPNGGGGTCYMLNSAVNCESRPSFYLNTSVKITDGSGTSSNPYRLSL